MIVGKQNILSWFNDLPEEVVYWRLYQPGQKQVGYATAESLQNDNLTKTDSLEDLRRKLGYLSSGKYTISAQGKAGNIVKGSYFTDFEISINENHNHNNNNNAQVGNVANMSGFISKEEVEKMADERFEKLMTKNKLEDAEKRLKELEKENKELKEDANSPLNQIAGLVIPMLTKKAAPLAQVGTLHTGTPNENVEMTLEEQQAIQRLQAVLNRVEVTFGELPVPFLERLLNYVDANPHFVGMIKGMI